MPLSECPVCGARYHSAAPDIQLTDRQARIYHAVGVVHRRNGVAYIEDVATEVGWSVPTVWRELVYLEQLGEVERRAGKRSGWRMVIQHGVKINRG